MRPDLTTLDTANVVRPHAVLFSYRALSSCVGADGTNLVSSQPSVSVVLAANFAGVWSLEPVSATIHHVLSVLANSARSKVCRVHAPAVVARMQDEHAIRDRSNVHCVGDSMGKHQFLRRRVAQNAVATSTRRSRPRPALVWSTLVSPSNHAGSKCRLAHPRPMGHAVIVLETGDMS